MNMLDKLNENQKKAVLHTEGPLLIFAGAGSGKTRVITHRIAYLMEEMHVPPWSIFAVTFTNKAAEEMKNRVASMIGPAGRDVFIRTFHSASVYILRRFGTHIGIPGNFSIFDQSDQESVVKRILMEMHLDPKKIRPSAIVSKISEVKDRAELVDGTDPASLLPESYSYDLSEIYRLYHEELKSQNALDFNDLLIKTVEVLRGSPSCLASLQSQWRYFMIDEYQDTNYSQYLISKYLSKGSRNICVVGDDDQSIYSWRGADIRNILNFESDYPDARVITLDRNYRSTEPILEAAQAVIRHNENRKDKDLKSEMGDGEPVTWCHSSNDYGEAEFTVNTIMSLKSREGFSNSDFAVFYRTNAQSRVIEDLLRRKSIPYRVVGGLRFYDRKEIRDIIAYLRFIVNPLDQVSLMRIINTPARGIGRATIDRIRSAAAEKSRSPWEVIQGSLLTGKVPKGLTLFRDVMTELMEALPGVPGSKKLSQFVMDIIESSGYRENLLDEKSAESTARLENIDEFVNSVYDYESGQPDAAMQDFLQDISLFTTEESPDAGQDSGGNAVTLMTVHNAKGLEFPVVFITGLEEEIFPHRLSIDSDEGIEEERRLCYVGITRAKERVYLTNAELRRTFGTLNYREPSRFISEIPGHIMQVKSYHSEGFSHNGNGVFRRRETGARKSAPSAPYPAPSPSPSPSPSPAPLSKPETGPGGSSAYSLHEQVLHPKYGVGRIIKIEGSGDNLKLTILFGSSSKTFMEKYTPLEKCP